jgi:hypothetical protein
MGAITAYAAANAQRLTPADVASLFHGLGSFGHIPSPSMLDAVLPRLLDLLPKMKPLEVSSTFWGMGLCHVPAQHPAWVKISGEVLPALHGAGRLDASLLRQAFQGFLAARLHDKATPKLDAGLTRAMWEAWGEGLQAAVTARELDGSSSSSGGGGGGGGARAAVAAGRKGSEGGMVRGAGAGGGGSSRGGRLDGSVRGQVLRLLDELGIVVHAVGQTTSDGLVIVDVHLRAGGSREVALQLVGEHNYVACGPSKGRLMGPALWQQDVLERNGFEVVFLPQAEYAAVASTKRAEFMSDLLSRLGIHVKKHVLAAVVARRAEQQAARKAGGAGGGGVGGVRGAVHSSGSAGSGSGRREQGRQQQGGGGGGGGVVRPSEADLLSGMGGGQFGGGRGKSSGRGNSSRRQVGR